MKVSCLMGTGDRREFVPRALRCFQAQVARAGDELELVIIDDGNDSIGDLVPEDDLRIRYYRSLVPMSLREKRQACYDAARGDIMVIWDDDDWHGPRRVGDQVAELERTGASACLLDPILFYVAGEDRTWRWSARGRYQMCVGTIAFTREYYELVPGGFPEPRETASDQQFVRDRSWKHVVYVDGEESYVAVRHGRNTSGCVITPGAPWSPARSARERLGL